MKALITEKTIILEDSEFPVDRLRIFDLGGVMYEAHHYHNPNLPPALFILRGTTEVATYVELEALQVLKQLKQEILATVTVTELAIVMDFLDKAESKYAASI